MYSQGAGGEWVEGKLLKGNIEACKGGEEFLAKLP